MFGAMASGLRDLIQRHVDSGAFPGAVALVAHGDRVEVEAAGSLATERGAPMTRDSIFRITSITKPIVAAALLTLVEEGRVGRSGRSRRRPDPGKG